MQPASLSIACFSLTTLSTHKQSQKNGVGLAAPQVNRSLRVFVMDGEDKPEVQQNGVGIQELEIIVNPRVIEVTHSFEHEKYTYKA